jgi:uncharacterized SAM-binding protein YcdF (DUF218 family)
MTGVTPNNLQIQRLLLALLRAAGRAALGLALLIGVLCALIVAQGQREEAQQSSAALVLGAAQWDGTPSPVLRARLDHALDLYRAGMVSRIILTGGVGAGDKTSEAAAGQVYLAARGVPTSTLILEQQGRSTWESLTNAAALARANGISSVLLVSDSFHMLRGLKMARDLHLNARGSPTRTSPIARNRTEEAGYILREAWAYLVYMLLRQ